MRKIHTEEEEEEKEADLAENTRQSDHGNTRKCSSEEPHASLEIESGEVEMPVDSTWTLHDDKDANHTFIDNILMWQHLLAVFILSVICLILGLFIPKINIVFGFTGAICGGFLGFIFPALMVIYSGGFTPQKQGWLMYVMSYVMLVVGVVGVVFGTGATIYSLAGGK